MKELLKIEDKIYSLKKPKKMTKSEMDVLISKMKEARMVLKKSKKEEAKKKSKKKKSDILISKMKEAGMDVEIFKPKKRKKNKKAVLIGLKHPRQTNIDNIKGLILRMKDHLIKLRGFPESNITLMIDEEDDQDEDEQHLQPTDHNVRATLCSLVARAEPGDILFIHLIAYGCYDGFIITPDKEHINDAYFRALIGDAVQRGCNLTFVSDCLIESADECLCPKIPRDIGWHWDDTEWVEAFFEENRGKKAQIVGYLNMEPTNLSFVDILNLNPIEEKKTHEIILSPNEDDEDDNYDDGDDDDDERVILLMPFIPYQNDTFPKSHYVSELLCPPPSKEASSTLYGVFTKVVLDVIEETHGQVTNLELAHKTMEKLGQVPSLRCTDHHHAYASFVC